ncbi:MAG: prepilin-type N-terminal cleavage/methylation domain-containing protein [Candidatus Pacebacteria bacterium]|nr:prepilin-type N-terminal cleavage/methylation domain-containing protein [Candidatus Paceibacterota bacterium]
MKNKGFTLVELLVVISIIGILSTIVVSSLGLSRERAREARFTAELNSFITALELYNLDNGEYPDEWLVFSTRSLHK